MAAFTESRPIGGYLPSRDREGAGEQHICILRKARFLTGASRKETPGINTGATPIAVCDFVNCCPHPRTMLPFPYDNGGSISVADCVPGIADIGL